MTDQRGAARRSEGVIDLGVLPGPDDRRLLVGFSHLRWDFGLQRQRRLMARFARRHEVLFWENPLDAEPGRGISLDRRVDATCGVEVVTPRLPAGLDEAQRRTVLEQLLGECDLDRTRLVRWYYTPMMLPFSRRLEAACTVYDCWEALRGGAHTPEFAGLERELLSIADVVFSGGHDVWRARRSRRLGLHALPAVDQAHVPATCGPTLGEAPAGVCAIRASG